MAVGGGVASDIALQRERRVFAICETVSGTREIPTDADAVGIIGDGRMVQDQEQVPNAEYTDSRSRLAPIQGRRTPGDWSVPIYLKPSGTAGLEPEADPFLVGLFGQKTVSGGSNVRYHLAKELPSLTIWMDFGHTVKWARGATVNQGDFTVQGDAVVSATFSGQFMEEFWTGSSQLDGAIDASVTDITVDDAKLYSPGSIFFIDEGLGTEEIIIVGSATTDVNTSTNVLSNCTRGALGSTASAHADNADVTPWLPDGTNLGSPVYGKFGKATVDGSDVLCRSSLISVRNNIRYLDDEKNSLLVAEQYLVSTQREISIRTSEYWRASKSAAFQQARELTQFAYTAEAGDLPKNGRYIRFSAPYCIQSSPNPGGGAEVTLEKTLQVIADPSGLDDEFSLYME